MPITTQNIPLKSDNNKHKFLKSTNHSFPAAKQMCLRSKLLFQSLELKFLHGGIKVPERVTI